MDAARVAVYGVVPEYGGRARPPTRTTAGPGWQDLHMIKPRDDHGRVPGIKLRVMCGTRSDVLACLGRSMAYIERSTVTSRRFTGRQVRKPLAYSKELAVYKAAAGWEDSSYTLIRPHTRVRLPVATALPQKWVQRTPAMAAHLTDHVWTVKELLTTLPVPRGSNT